MEISNTQVKTKIPSWCKQNGWVYHLPTASVFQASKLQIDKSTDALFLLDAASTEYPVAQCQELTAQHLSRPATLITATQKTPLTPHRDGVMVNSPKRLLVTIPAPDEGDRAAQSLSAMFQGSVYTETGEPHE